MSSDFARDDITEKVCEVWRDLMAKYDRGEISGQAFRVGFRAAYDSVSGFADFSVISPMMDEFEADEKAGEFND